MNTSGHPDPIDRFVDSLLCCSSQLMVVVDHMARHENPEAAEPPNVVLARLLREILEPEFTDREADLATAATVVDATAETIGQELYLVGPEGPPEGPGPAPAHAGRRHSQRRRR